MTAIDDLREHLHGMWSTVSDAWAEHADYVEARAAAVTERMLELAALRAGDEVLELACGGGGLGLAAARRAGRVTVSDVSAEMVAVASARAQALGLDNVEAEAFDFEDIPRPDESFDVVLCREGLMFALDPARAAGEIRRVLRPGGRVGIAVWGPRERNPWLGIVMDAVSAELGRPVPPAGVPGPFSLSDPSRLGAVLSRLRDVSVREVEAPARAASFEDWWERTCALAGPLTSILASLPAAPVRERAREAARAYETPDGLEFPGLTLLASATR
jgi:ubiquinone/menaquinone biosynthesis C-methylase UbiE